ncbi:MAG: TolC family protein [Deltaproteobacteria bacterium]|nr:TolC family protein [Deltaproteobacteria bacterium]
MMKLSNYFSFLCLLGLLLMLSPATQSQAFTLDQCVELAVQNNPELQKQQLGLQFAGNDLTEQKALKFGRLDFVASYTRYNLPRTLAPLTPGSIATNPAAVPTTEDLFTSGFVYEVPLFTGFAQTRAVEIAALQKEFAAATLKLSREQLIYNVKTLFVNILSLRQQEKAQTAYVESLQRLYAEVTRELQLGKKARIDQLKAAADLESARAGRTQIRANISILRTSLASLLNLEQLPILQKIELRPESIQPVQNHFTDRLGESERLRAARLTLHKNAKLVDKVAAALYPQIVLNTAYGQNFGPNNSGHVNSGDWNNQHVWQLGLNLKWNIFDFGSTRAKLKKARIVEQQSRYEQTKTELELKRAIKEAVTRINTAVSNYRSARTELDMTRETAAIEEVRFKQGAAPINDLLYARARNRLAESRFIAAGYAYKTAQFQLDYLLESGENR